MCIQPASDVDLFTERPEERIAWKTIGGEVNNDGTDTFEQLGDDHARTIVEMQSARRSEVERGARAGLLSR